MSSITRELEMESRIRQLESDLRSATNLRRQVSEAVEYMAYRGDELEERVFNRSTSSVSNWSGSSEDHLAFKITFLEEQIEKLESKLEKATENLTLEKEKNRKNQADLLRMEQEMRDSKIELRIAQRESKTAVAKLVKLEESATFSDSSQMKAKDEEIECLRLELKKLTTDLEEAKKSLLEKDQDAEERKKELDIAKEEAATAREHLKEAQRFKDDLAISQRLKRTTELALKNAEEHLSRHNEENSRLIHSLEEEKAKLVEKEAIISSLKQTVNIMEETLKTFEAFGNDAVEKESTLESEKSRLRDEVERIKKELSAAKKKMNEDKSLQLLTENRLKEMKGLLENQKAEFITEISSLKQAVIRAESEAKQLKTANMGMEKLLADAESTFDARLVTLEEKNAELEKELTVQMTQCNSLENENYLLGEKLSEALRRSESYEERILRADFALDNANKIHAEREHKFEVTLLQHGKLIDFLQAIADQSGKKNKTLTDKLLGSGGSGTPKRENRYSDVGIQNPAYKDLEERLEKKDGQIRLLTNQLKECKAELAAAKTGKRSSTSSSLTADVATPSVEQFYT